MALRLWMKAARCWQRMTTMTMMLAARPPLPAPLPLLQTAQVRPHDINACEIVVRCAYRAIRKVPALSSHLKPVIWTDLDQRGSAFII